ncbi:MAG TPA: DUF924 family protein [Caldimonas sp.]|nr:DUF924 family protein [Caldimonas sp.]
MSHADHTSDVDRILDFWFGAPGSDEYASLRKIWFAKDASFDRRIVETFSPLIEKALRGELDDWGTDELSALARILLLDQFTRNAFRGQARAFAGDAQALAAASAMVGAKLDERLPPFMRAFVYLPFEHAEGMAMQDESVRLFSRLAATSPELGSMLDFAKRHRDVIDTFGRFPHRNAALGRASTAAEVEYLSRPGSGF